VNRHKERWPLHVALGVGLTICAVAFVVELQRGLGGHLPAWVYVIEWPLFGAGGVYLWWRLLRDEDAPTRPPTSEPREGDDPELDAWRAYVRRVDSGSSNDPARSNGPDKGRS
jgi:hypothetical protein